MPMWNVFNAHQGCFSKADLQLLQHVQRKFPDLGEKFGLLRAYKWKKFRDIRVRGSGGWGLSGGLFEYLVNPSFDALSHMVRCAVVSSPSLTALEQVGLKMWTCLVFGICVWLVTGSLNSTASGLTWQTSYCCCLEGWDHSAKRSHIVPALFLAAPTQPVIQALCPYLPSPGNTPLTWNKVNIIHKQPFCNCLQWIFLLAMTMILASLYKLF